MLNYAVAGVAPVEGYDASGNMLFTSSTLTDSGFNATTTLEEIRGGFGNALQAQYAHTSLVTVALKDSLVNFNYLALQVGGDITTGGQADGQEEITTTVANQITVTGTPVAYGNFGIVGWYKIKGSSDVPTKITFTGKVASVANLPSGTTVCVRYIVTDNAASVFAIASTFMPKVIRLVVHMPLIQAGATDTLSSTAKIGEWRVDIPKFQFNGTIDMATTSAGAAKGDISGKALSSGATTCNGDAIYATITQIIYNADQFADVKSIAVVDSDVDLTIAGTQTLEILAVKKDNTTFKIDNSLLTFTSATPATATVSSAGLVTGVAAGNTDVEVVVTGHTALVAYAHVTVTA